jgi:hypothetical protein
LGQTRTDLIVGQGRITAEAFVRLADHLFDQIGVPDLITDLRRAALEGARILLVPDQLAGERQSEPAVLHGPRDARPAALELPALPRQIEAAHGLAGMRPTFPDQIVAQPRTGLIAEGHVLSREMQVHYPSVSRRPRPVE